MRNWTHQKGLVKLMFSFYSFDTMVSNTVYFRREFAPMLQSYQTEYSGIKLHF